MYVGDGPLSKVYVYAYPSGKQIDTFKNGLEEADGVAVTPAAPL